MSLKNKKIFVSGAGGFIGSHLVESLVNEGADVTAFIHYNSNGSYGWLDDSPCQKDIKFVLGDVTDQGSVESAMKGTDVVFHLAALIGIPYSYIAPISYVRTNVEGTLNIMQVAREQGVSRVIHTSTSETYGTALSVPINEEHPLQGQSPYSASKIGADKIAESYYCSFDLPVVTVRPFNTYGPRQSSRAIIPTVVTQCLAGKRSIKLGNVTPTRDMNFVSNTVDAFIAASTAYDAIGKTINIGSGIEISIKDLVLLIARLTNKDIHIETDPDRVRSENSEVERLLADNTQAKKILNWEPKVSLEEGLGITIEWLEKHLSSYKHDKYVI